MNYYDQQLQKLLAQCARKRRLEASAAELRRQRDTYAARAEELEQTMQEEQADVDRLEGRSLAAFFYNVVGKMDEKLTQERQEAYAARVKYDAGGPGTGRRGRRTLRRCQAELKRIGWLRGALWGAAPGEDPGGKSGRRRSGRADPALGKSAPPILKARSGNCGRRPPPGRTPCRRPSRSWRV